jgi:AraC family transcriptional regulator, positive regulator of tynA and feaB
MTQFVFRPFLHSPSELKLKQLDTGIENLDSKLVISRDRLVIFSGAYINRLVESCGLVDGAQCPMCEKARAPEMAILLPCAAAYNCQTDRGRGTSHDTIFMESMMVRNGDFVRAPQLDYETWTASFQALCGRYTPEGTRPSAFTGWVHALKFHDLLVLDVGSNAQRLERTARDTRLDGLEHYAALFQITGCSAVSHNNHVVSLVEGDIALIDATKPVSYHSIAKDTKWNCLSIRLPRKPLVAYLGFEPKGGTYRHGTVAQRVLLDICRNADDSDGGITYTRYMQLAVYDLVGALFAPSDPKPISRHQDRLFSRLERVIKDGITDPDFGPSAVAAELGISLRYVQKLFTERGSTCGDLIYSLRLDHAARLLHRRALHGMSQSLSEIAYASGFRDYAHFARRFRRRFGYAPSAHARRDHRSGGETMCTDIGPAATHDILKFDPESPA